MELEDLKSEWQHTDMVFRSEADLLKMTKIKNHPSVMKIRIKLMVEIICFVLLLTVYYDWFDGNQKPMLSNVLLVSSLLLYFVNDVIGYVSLVIRINGLNLKASLGKYVTTIRRLSVFSLICTFLYSTSFLIFFSSVNQFTKEKSFILLFLVIVLFQMIFWSQRMWSKWVKNLEQLVKNFDIEDVS